jgi:S-adenosylmethionine:tRNA ribosyltransferase-isomerase
MQRTDFYFDLPPALIAQRPAAERSASRLLSLAGADGALRDLQFKDFASLLNPGDLLVFNDTRVIPARIFGVKHSGGRVELLLERALDARTALVQVRASKGLKPGVEIKLPGGTRARMRVRDGSLFVLEFSRDVLELFALHGQIPLPPYINREADAADVERYQTLYARESGAVAAPTAGLHFDATVFEALAARGVGRAYVTLHVGAGTFAPVRSERIEDHAMHAERVVVTAETCAAIETARRAGGRIVAVGTTVVRSLESAAQAGKLEPFGGSTRIFIRPGYRFRVVDALLTNFHLPESTLLMLCAALVGREALLAAYAHAVRESYRFFSYGDAMFLTPAPDALEPR